MYSTLRQILAILKQFSSVLISFKKIKKVIQETVGKENS